MGDLTLGWAGAVVAALLVGIRVPGTLRSPGPADTRLSGSRS
ncbi:hypothetical protein NOCA1190116 [metagenome]|uniref:Uncharacterized protein n=1 Tax=metagenome TaxID=256318 RepID=A0A2P2CCZ5_9ZZZZ